MKPNLLQHINARLTVLEKNNILNYRRQHYSCLENELIQKVPEYTYHEVSNEVKGVYRRIHKLLGKDNLASGWSSSEVEAYFPDQSTPESIYIDGKSMDIELDPKFKKDEENKIAKQSEQYFEKLKEYHSRVFLELNGELSELLRVIENIQKLNDSRIAKEEDISRHGFELAVPKHWVLHVFNYFMKTGVLNSNTSYEQFKKVFSDSPVDAPISINEGYQGVLTLFMKEVLSNGKNIVSNNSKRWERVSNMFLFNGKTLSPARLKSIKISDVGDKVKLVNDAISYIPTKE